MTRYYMVGGTHGSHPVAYSEHNAAAVEHGRLVAVIDFEDREQVERLAMTCHYGLDPDAMQAALREFADPQPVKPPEPTGLGAVVKDDEGRQYVLVTGDDEAPWVRVPSPEWQVECFAWADIAAVEVLSDGYEVTP